MARDHMNCEISRFALTRDEHFERGYARRRLPRFYDADQELDAIGRYWSDMRFFNAEAQGFRAGVVALLCGVSLAPAELA